MEDPPSSFLPLPLLLMVVVVENWPIRRGRLRSSLRLKACRFRSVSAPLSVRPALPSDPGDAKKVRRTDVRRFRPPGALARLRDRQKIRRPNGPEAC